MIKAVRICRSYLTNVCLMKEGVSPSLWGWVAGLLNSAAVVLWRRLGNGGNWWTYPVTLESQLMWAPRCSPVRRPQAGGRAVSRDTAGFHDFLHGLRCTYMNSGMSGWKGQTLLILKCCPMLRCSPHTDTHLTFSQNSVTKNNTKLSHIWQSGLIWSIWVIGSIYWSGVGPYFRSLVLFSLSFFKKNIRLILRSASSYSWSQHSPLTKTSTMTKPHLFTDLY